MDTGYDGMLLSLLIWVPIFGGLAVLMAGEQRAALARWIALAASGATLLLSVPLVQGFDTGTAAMQFVEFSPWIEASIRACTSTWPRSW